MIWWVLLGIVVVLAAVVAWQRRGRSKGGLTYDANSPTEEHERFQRGTDGRAGS
jgi:hypothetical protein